MKAEGKRLGTKHKIRAEKEREGRIALAIFLAFILLVVAILVYFGYSFINQPTNQKTSPETCLQPKAAIVDLFSLTSADRTFIETATSILEQANYTVDYYPGEKVTVELYRDLPTGGYELVILRVHSSASELQGTGKVECPVVFFTSEPYSKTKYVYEQLADQIVCVSYNVPQPPYYFAVTPGFVTSSTNGRFHNTIVVMMGCQGLTNNKMAEAFIEKGAKAYIGWNGAVSASHTDEATTCLLKHLISRKETVEQAVDNTVKEVGPDPNENNTLAYYPLEAGAQTIESINNER